MKHLFIVLFVICLTGCASTPFVSSPPPNPPGNQVVILTQRGCWGTGDKNCGFTVKNIGDTDVRNVRFKLTNSNGQYKSTSGRIDYLPSKETMDFVVGVYYAPFHNDPYMSTIVVDSYEIVR